jgi:hypothetical protein
MQERRGAPRKRSFLKGIVYFNNRLSSIDCVIRDFSNSGARLEFAAAVSLPDTVELFIPTRDQTLASQVRWRKADEVGVSFADPPATPGSAGDLAQRLSTLERDFEKLQRIVQELRTDLRRTRGED